MHIFSNILGIFVFDEKFNAVEEVLFSNPEDFKNRESIIAELKNKHKSLKEPDEEALKSILFYFKNKKYFSDFYSKNLQLSISGVKNSATKDILIAQAINSVEDTGRTANFLAKRLREWYELHNPEFSLATENNEKFAHEILEKEKKELLDGIGINIDDSIGADFGQKDLEPVMGLAREIYSLFRLREIQLGYVSALMGEICPNIKAVCGVLTGAKLIEHAGSLKRLSEMPASTIQILGAEKALFRHMKTGAKPPRHGLIASHPLVAQTPERMRGKTARALSDKISIASKVDYFQGQFIGNTLKEGLEKRFGSFEV